MASKPGADGHEVIPASRRPDGTWRKEIRVKAGYVPPDEVAKYESKGKRFISEQPKYPPGYAPPSEETKKLSKNQKKNERKKQQRREKAEAAQAEQSLEEDLSELKVSQDNSKTNSEQSKAISSGRIKDPELQKKIRAVRKKIKHCEQLEEKKAKGETLEKEQIEKLSKRAEFVDELKELEAQIE